MSAERKRKYRRVARRLEAALDVAWKLDEWALDNQEIMAWLEEGDRLFNYYADLRDAERP